MRKFIDIVTLMEKVVADYSNPFDPVVAYEIHKNGSRRDLGKLRASVNPHNTSKDIRGILTSSGDLYFFDGWASAHAGIKSFLNLDGLHLTLFDDHVGVGWGRRHPTRAMFDAAEREIKASTRVQALYGPDVKVIAMEDIIEPTVYRDY